MRHKQFVILGSKALLLRALLSFTLLMLISFLCSGCSSTDYLDILSENSLVDYQFKPSENSALTLARSADIDEHSVTAVLPKGTDLTSLIASFELEGYALYCNGERQVSGKSVIDCSGQFNGKLYSLDGRYTRYSFSIEESKAFIDDFVFDVTSNNNLDAAVEAEVSGNGIWFYISHKYALDGLVPNYYFEQDRVEVGGKEQVPGETSQNFESELVYTVYADDGRSMDYQISAYRLCSLVFRGDDNKFDEDYAAHLDDGAIDIELPLGTDVSKLVPEIYFLGSSLTVNEEVYEAGKSYDFSSAIAITVETNTGLSHSYTVSVSLEEDPYNAPNSATPAVTNTPDTPDTPDSATTLFTIKYHGNGATSGSVPVDTTKYSENQSATLAANSGNLHIAGYSFDGWNSEADGSGTSYAAGDTLVMTADLTLYAMWKVNAAATIRFDGNGNDGGSAPAAITTSWGMTVTLPDEGTLSLSTYAFGGWNSEPDGSGTFYSEFEQIVMPEGGLTLYAQWANFYTLSFDGKGKSYGSVPSDMSVAEGATTTLPGRNSLVGPALASPSNITQRFLGWSENPLASVADYTEGDSFVMGSSDITLYAVWTSGSDIEGKIGPGGGYVFYCDTTNVYYECAPEDLASLYIWGESSISLVTSAGVGYGKQNSYEIVYQDATAGTAAKACFDYSASHRGTNFDDWFLPSSAEFGKLSVNLDSFPVIAASFSGSRYWSSKQTTTSSSSGYTYEFGDISSVQNTNKGTKLAVRPIRVFSAASDKLYSVYYCKNSATGGNSPDDASFYERGDIAITEDNSGILSNSLYYFAGWNTQSDAEGDYYDTSADLTIVDSDVVLYDVWAEVGITTAEDLYKVRDDLSGTYVLLNDIDLASSPYSNWVPIGRVGLTSADLTVLKFSGKFYGRGYSITGLQISSNSEPDTNYYGLFAYLDSNGLISNLCLDSVYFELSKFYCLGALVGRNDGKIRDCSALSKDSGGDYDMDINCAKTGGLVGYNTGIVENSSAEMNIDSSATHIGGLVGYNDGGTITNCYATGAVCAGNNTGGLVGTNLSGTVEKSYAVGGVTVSSCSNIGGLVGKSEYGTIQYCYSSGVLQVADCDYVGSLVGYSMESTISNSYARGSVSSGDTAIGGIAGKTEGGTIEYCYAACPIGGASNTGGLVGSVNVTTISKSFYDEDLDGLATGGDGTAKTTSEMKTESTFTDAGWDFDTIWAIDASTPKNDGYPYLIELKP